jgi:hypothetical protein
MKAFRSFRGVFIEDILEARAREANGGLAVRICLEGTGETNDEKEIEPAYDTLREVVQAKPYPSVKGLKTILADYPKAETTECVTEDG